MRVSRPSLLILALALPAVAAGPASADDPAAHGTIGGSVLSDGATPLAGATVEVRSCG